MPKMPHKSRNSFRVMSGVGYYWLVLRIAFRFSLHVACGRQAVMRRTSLPCNLHHSRLKLSLSRNRCKQGFGLVYKVGSCVAVTLKFLIHIHVSNGFMATIGSIYAGRKKECHCVRIRQWSDRLHYRTSRTGRTSMLWFLGLRFTLPAAMCIIQTRAGTSSEVVQCQASAY